ncbi:NAD(P)/FAD-dependent oxidoreductase [Capillimicrobium parvum]|nr:FAD-dependent oxidoreductase [Capillimicrobium parvum]
MPVSFWMRRLEPLPPPRPPLDGDRDADVCIVGAGYTGLWTAYELKRAQPDLDVVVLESRFAGFGASGRNGGWVLGDLAGSRERWARGPAGRAGVTALLHAVQAAVDEVGAAVDREGIACDFVKDGSLQVAQSELELERVRGIVEEERRWGRDTELLDGPDATKRVAVDGVLGAAFTAHCARVQPAKLVRGLADAVQRAGATIHESTRVTSIAPGAAHTAAGVVRARHVVRATEGYSARLDGHRRVLLPMNSAMIVTEPLDAGVWEQVGWAGAETLSDARHRFVYLQRTADGRVAIGGRGVPYRFGSGTAREGPVPARTIDELRTRLAELFPVLRDAPIDDAWHGILGVPRNWSPSVGLDPTTGIAWAGGYVGEGVAAANLAGRTLRDLLLGRDTELTRLPWVGPAARRWEPEPLRFAGVQAVYALYAAADRRERGTGRPSLTGRLGHAIAGH